MNFPDNAPCSSHHPGNFRREYIAYLLLLSAHMLLVWLVPFFPTQDGPSHLYNLIILQDLLNGGKTWGSFFTHQVNAVPNLGFTIIGYPLLKIFPILDVERIFLTIYLFLLGATVPLLLKAFGKPPLPLGFLVFPVVFNFTLMMGFYSYNMAVALFLAAFCMAWAMRLKPLATRAVCYNLAGLAIYFFHLIPFIFYLLSLYAMDVTDRNSPREKCLNLLKLSLILSPSLVLLAWYFAQSKGGMAAGVSTTLTLGRFRDLFINLLIFSSAPFSRWQLIPAALLMFVALLGGYLTLKDVPRRSRLREITHAERVLFLMVGALTVIYFVAPFRLGDGSYFNERFPWVILLLSLPLMSIPAGRFPTYLLAGIASLYLLINAAVLRGQSNQVALFVKSMVSGCSRGDLVMTYKRPDTPGWAKVDPLLHAVSYHGIFKGCIDIGNYETAMRYFPVHFKETLPPLPTPDQVAWEPENIDFGKYPAIRYLIGWKISEKDKTRLGNFFRIVMEEEQVTVWSRISRSDG
ncbi:MAG: hypothetical protein HYS23_15915 [Geobacter sp.]|nr:hypothetical protein [Geobacter sp.]